MLKQKISTWAALTLLSSFTVFWSLLITDRILNRYAASKITENYLRQPYIYGDADNDGFIGLTDAVVIMHYVRGRRSGINTVNADYNGDRIIDVKDARAVLTILYNARSACNTQTMDFNHNGVCDSGDIEVFLEQN